MPSTLADHAYGSRRCDRAAPPLLKAGSAHGDVAALGRASLLSPRLGVPLNAAALVQADEPALLRDTGWAPAARRWTWPEVRALLAGTVLDGVIHTSEHHYLVPDSRAAQRGRGPRTEAEEPRPLFLNLSVLADGLRLSRDLHGRGL